MLGRLRIGAGLATQHRLQPRQKLACVIGFGDVIISAHFQPGDALILGALPELFRPLAEFRILFYALMLLLMIRFQPGGILGESSLIRKRLLPLFLGGQK